MHKINIFLPTTALLFSFLLIVGCGDDEGTGPTTRSSATENSSDGTRDDTSSSEPTGGLGEDSSSSSSSDSSSNDSSSTSSSSSEYAAMEKKAHDLVNDYRATKGLSALTLVESISSVCRAHSEDMATIKVLSHDGFDGRADTLQTTVGWTGIAENVAFNNGFSDPEQTAVTGWIGSPGHEVNMSGNFTKTGMGVAKNADGSYYFTQIFIR